MKITQSACVAQHQRTLDVAFDVSKASLSVYSELDDGSGSIRELEAEVENRSDAIAAFLEEVRSMSRECGYDATRVVCEPTGGFERRLLHCAARLGMLRAYVNGESVHRLQVVEDNSDNKTDRKDCRTILTVAKLGKTLRCRELDPRWQVLRRLNVRHDQIERYSTMLKNQIWRSLRILFPELSFKKDWLFGKTGRIVMEAYRLDPCAMLRSGEVRMKGRLARLGLRASTLRRLWEDAKSSCRCQLGAELREEIADELADCFEQLWRRQEQREKVRWKMSGMLEELKAERLVRLDGAEALANPFLLARIVAETGPLADFASDRQLLKYAGLNLRQRQSGTMKGEDRLAKKGRPLLRKALSQACLKLVMRDQPFGKWYRRKKDRGMIGPKAMAASCRKLLQALHALDRTGKPFQRERLFAQPGGKEKVA